VLGTGTDENESAEGFSGFTASKTALLHLRVDSCQICGKEFNSAQHALHPIVLGIGTFLFSFPFHYVEILSKPPASLVKLKSCKQYYLLFFQGAIHFV
jgi:hypothetical protein